MARIRRRPLAVGRVNGIVISELGGGRETLAANTGIGGHQFAAGQHIYRLAWTDLSRRYIEVDAEGATGCVVVLIPAGIDSPAEREAIDGAEATFVNVGSGSITFLPDGPISLTPVSTAADVAIPPDNAATAIVVAVGGSAVPAVGDHFLLFVGGFVPLPVSAAEATGGANATLRLWSALRVREAVLATALGEGQIPSSIARSADVAAAIAAVTAMIPALPLPVGEDEAEAGASAVARLWSALRVRQAVRATPIGEGQIPATIARSADVLDQAAVDGRVVPSVSALPLAVAGRVRHLSQAQILPAPEQQYRFVPAEQVVVGAPDRYGFSLENFGPPAAFGVGPAAAMGLAALWASGTLAAMYLYLWVREDRGVVTAVHLHGPHFYPSPSLLVPMTRSVTQQVVDGVTYRAYTSTNPIEGWNLASWINLERNAIEIGVGIAIGADYLNADGTLSAPTTLQPGYYAAVNRVWMPLQIGVVQAGDPGSGPSQTASDAVRSIPHQVVLWGRFENISLDAQGLPPAPNHQLVQFGDRGVSVLGGAWQALPNIAQGPGALWRAEAVATYVAGAWSISAWARGRVPTDSVLYATDDAGTGASVEAPAGWTHFAFRLTDGSLSAWISRSGALAVRRFLWSTTDNFNRAVRTVLGSYEFNLNAYRYLEFEFTEWFQGFTAVSWRGGPARWPTGQIQTVGLNVDGRGGGSARAYRVQIGGQHRIATVEAVSSEAIPGTWPNGCLQDLEFEAANQAGAAARVVTAIKRLSGCTGAGNLAIWGVP